MIWITKEEYEKLNTELIHRRDVLGPQITDEIRNTTSHGDRFPSPYAMKKQDMNDRRIKELDEYLKKASIKDETLANSDTKVELGSKIKLKKEDGTTMEITLITSEVYLLNPSLEKLSEKTPLGKALLGKSIGELVKITTPIGERSYTIISIT